MVIRVRFTLTLRGKQRGCWHRERLLRFFLRLLGAKRRRLVQSIRNVYPVLGAGDSRLLRQQLMLFC